VVEVSVIAGERARNYTGNRILTAMSRLMNNAYSFTGIQTGTSRNGTANNAAAVSGNGHDFHTGQETLDDAVEPQSAQVEMDPTLKKILNGTAWEQYTGRKKEIFLLDSLSALGYQKLSGSYYNPSGHLLAKGGKVVAKIHNGQYTAMNGSLPDDLVAVFNRAGLKPQAKI